MTSQKPHGTLLKEVLAGKEASLPRTLLSELLKLPAARSFPPMAGIKRGRKPAAAATRQLADAAAGLTLKSSSPPLDATGLLLVEAATQLSWLVKQQLQRRTLRAVRSSRDAGSDSDSDGGHRQITAGKGAGGCASGSQGAGSPRGIHAAGTGTTSVATVSAGVSVGVSGPCSAPVSLCLSRCKRTCLERQYAIDSTGHCLMAGQRVLLPSAESFAGVQLAPAGGAE